MLVGSSRIAAIQNPYRRVSNLVHCSGSAKLRPAAVPLRSRVGLKESQLTRRVFNICLYRLHGMC
jgi:hypothetical protein